MPNKHPHKTGPDDLLSLRQAARILSVNPTWLAGVLHGMGVELMPAGRSLVIRRRDLAKVQVPQKQEA